MGLHARKITKEKSLARVCPYCHAPTDFPCRSYFGEIMGGFHIERRVEQK